MAYATEAQVLLLLGIDTVEATGPYSSANISLHLTNADATVDAYAASVATTAMKTRCANQMAARYANHALKMKELRGMTAITDPQGLSRTADLSLPEITPAENRMIRPLFQSIEEPADDD